VISNPDREQPQRVSVSVSWVPDAAIAFSWLELFNSALLWGSEPPAGSP